MTPASLDDYYDYWRRSYLRPSNRVDGGCYVNYEAKASTCSEAIGYGMLASVFFSHWERARFDFDALNRFRKAFPSNMDRRFMAWRVEDDSDVPVDTGSATDGDMDIAYALLIAAKKWNESAYLEEAKVIIDTMKQSLVREDFSLRRGDWDTSQHCVRLSDVMPTHFRAFCQVSDSAFWKDVAKAHYEILDMAASTQGVFPDFVVLASGNQWVPAPPKYLESDYDGMMYYNSCRVPWRLAWAVLEDDDEYAKKLLAKFGRGIGHVTNAQFKAGYRMDGSPVNCWTDGAFTAPHMCSLAALGHKKDCELAYHYHLMQKEKYFQDSLRLLALHLCEKR